MSIRGLGDAWAFQRLLWLLIGTVIIPTVLLALYGVWAIRNHRVTLMEGVRTSQLQELQRISRRLSEKIDNLDADLRVAVQPCLQVPETSCDVQIPGVATVWVWSDPWEMPEELMGLGLPADASVETRWYSPVEEDPVGFYAPSGDPLRVAWRLDTSRLATFAAEIGSGDGGEVRLEPVASGPAERLGELLPGQPMEVQLPLDRPLAQWRLTSRLEDPRLAVGFMGRNAWLYAAGLIVLVGTVVTGTIVTLNSANREIRLSRLQTDFVSSVSHELRTPLTSIRMFVETLQSGRLADQPERVEECLDLLAQETDRLSRMIERVLEWARMESGRRIYEVEEIQAGELVSEALQALRTQRLMLDDQTAIDVEIEPGLPSLRVDRDAIVEALLNLLQNAIKYTPNPRKIRVYATRKGKRVGLSVEDNGPGISRRHRRRIFEKFYQADSLLSSPHQGSGLGLAIVRAVVRGHGGRVELDTELGRGSRFTLWLPAASG